MKRSLFATLCVAIALCSCQDPIQPTSPGIAAVGTRGSASTAVWSPRASMGQARTAFGAATGLDGRVYVAGGYYGGSGVVDFLASAEVYDPSLDTWAPIAPMPGGQALNQLVALDNGLIYSIGGYDADQGGFNIINTYDPRNNTWRSDRTQGVPGYAAAVGFGGRIYLIGGQGGGVNGITPAVSAYDPRTATWTSVRKLLQPRELAAAAVLDGKLYVTGGYVPFDYYAVPTAGGEVYDPRTDTWTAIAPMRRQRYLHRLEAGPDGLLYAFGGEGAYAGEVEAYDPRTNAWTDIAARMNVAREYFASTVLPGGQIVALGGCNPAIGVGGDMDMCADPSLAMSSVEALSAPTNLPPTASNIGPYSGKEGSPIVFNASNSSDPDGDVLTFDWDFGDGATLSNGGPTPTHTYASAGFYRVTVTVTDPGGLQASQAAGVTVLALTPTEAAGALDNTVDQLLASGAITAEVAGQLGPSIEAAAASLARGNTNSASNQLNAFIQKAQAAIKTGKIEKDTGDALIAAANKILASL